MSKDNSIHECLPKIGFLFEEDAPATIVSKPKLMPLKTVTLEKVNFLFLNFLLIFYYNFWILVGENAARSWAQIKTATTWAKLVWIKIIKKD